MVFYAFLQQFSGPYYRIYKIEPFEKAEEEILKLKDYDLAIKITERAMHFYYQAKRDGKILLIRKDELNDSFLHIKDFVLFSDLNITQERLKKLYEEKNELIDDEDIKNEIFFNNKKEEYLKRLLNYIFPNINMFNIISFYSFIEDWSTLFTSGFVINDDNKEDVFIEIIEKDDDKLLSVLERFLQEREDLEKFKKLLRKFYIIRDEFDYMSYWDYDSLDEALEELEKTYLKYKDEFENLLEKARKRKNEDLALFYQLKNEFKKKKQSS